jgi:isocitrate/isopropylmalate dehydrogenase
MEKAVDTVLLEGVHRTYDLGGKSKTDEMGDAIVTKIEKMAAAFK